MEMDSNSNKKSEGVGTHTPPYAAYAMLIMYILRLRGDMIGTRSAGVGAYRWGWYLPLADPC